MISMSEWKFILGYLVFLTYMIAIVSLGGPQLVSWENPSVTPPICDIGGWDAVIDVIKCTWTNLRFFFSMITASPTVRITSAILGILTGTMLYIILRMLRGGG